ncbi:glycosyl hydrolase 115 family protein [Bifidobacterium sp. 82T10]|uniref:Glycosyl hydrolase 115 family protein n=1 Tax=Bifidobacterium miconis TaxID=2834435 RepID=A0ABS6WFY7_9BIFI|nr:glycosyl hydrolase 115 family protein [Bifidobacterium miconis]MBW3092930.1 glycosyl hydrolase 115 family protein [Bifidobacterium miconis]
MKIYEYLRTPLATSIAPAAPVIVDGAYHASACDAHAERTWRQITRAAQDLRQDIAMTTGAIDWHVVQSLFADDQQTQAARLDAADADATPALISLDAPDQLAATDAGTRPIERAIIVGAIGRSAIVDTIIANGLFNEAKQITARTEAFALKEVDHPIPGVDHALVIAGSDARGTIYGIYALSERIGVSPWFWWGDVPIDVRPIIDVDYTHACVELGPAVPYRGFFINDEDWSIIHWNRKKFPNPQIAPDVNYYRHVFELLLRLRGNLLWPAMHPESVAFNRELGPDGVPINAREAELYGVIMGSSHCEILLRNNEGEWDQWYERNHEKFHMRGASVRASYDFTLNREALIQYWRERLETNKGCECSLTVGIRGIHDGAFNVAELDRYPGATRDEKEVAFMEDVIATQRALIEEVYGKEEASRIPQVLIPYKEMNDVYNHGLNRIMERPEYRDITLMWAEDDYGFLRQTPTRGEQAREGGSGVYYHNSYVGRPTNNTWLNSSQLPLMSEQMHRAWDTGMRTQWVINIGDIKLSDISTEFFIKLGWDPVRYTDRTIGSQFITPLAKRDWGVDDDTARQLADAFDEFQQIIAIRQPGFNLASLNPEGANAGIDLNEFTFNPAAFGDEAQRWLDRCNALSDKLRDISDSLGEARRTAFFEQLYYAVLSSSDTAGEYVNFWKAQLAAKQGRVNATRRYIALSRQSRDAIVHRNDYLDALNGGKWAGVIKYDTHLGDDHDLIEDDQYPAIPTAGRGVDAAAEGQDGTGSGLLRFDSAVTDDTRFFDVFSREDMAEPVTWHATAPSWVRLSADSGATADEQRITVTVDWQAVEVGKSTGEIAVYSDSGTTVAGESKRVATFAVTATKHDVRPAPATNDTDDYGYAEADGYLAFEAEHASKVIDGLDGSSWKRIEHEGQHGDTMKAFPDRGISLPGAGAKLVYHLYFDQAGAYAGRIDRLPTFNEGFEDDGTARGCRIAVSMNGGAPVEIAGNNVWSESRNRHSLTKVWERNIIRGYESLPFEISVHAGWNTFEITRVDASMVLDRVVIETQPGALTRAFHGPDESPRVLVASR